ncbi:MAG TPA: hypothetical protein VF417_04150, partial [Candidatus Methylomirabilis sp.]
MSPFVCGEAEPPANARRLRFAAVLTSLFLVIAAVGAIHHEFWRDEMQAWLIARDAPSLPALLEQAHYEGAPPLWQLLLRPLTLVTHRPEAMQVLNWAIAGITVFFLCYAAPFGRLQKVLLVGNYYLLFEYGIVCRNYLPGILLLAVSCALFPSAEKRPWAFALSLIGAALASVHSLIIAAAFAAAFGAAWCLGALRRKQAGDAPVGLPPILPLLVMVAGIGLAVYSMVPRPDTLYSPAAGWSLNWDPDRLAKLSWAFVCSHFPWPRPPGFFWIPPWDMPYPTFDHRWAFVLASVLFVGMLVILRRHLAALLFYVVGTLGLAAFLYFKYLGFYRHTGFLFFALLFALWLRRTDGVPRGSGAALWGDRMAGAGLTAMLVLQAVMGLWAVGVDY